MAALQEVRSTRTLGVGRRVDELDLAVTVEAGEGGHRQRIYEHVFES
jgi:hypothetical protein